MYVTLNRMLKETREAKYNKNEIMAFVIIMIGLGAVYMFAPTSSLSGLIVCFSAFFLLCIVQSGCYAIASNNEILQRETIFPTTKDFVETIQNGFKFFFGSLALIMISFILPTIIIVSGLALSFFAATVNTSSALLTAGIILMFAGMVTYVVLLYMFILPLCVQYLKSLNLKDLFDFKKANELRLANKKLYNSYFTKIILAGLLAYIIGGIFAVIFTICAVDYLAKLPQDIAKENIQIVASITAMIFQTLWFPNLHGQFMNYKEPETNTQEIQQQEQ